MRDFHRDLAMDLRGKSMQDGRWLIFGYPPNSRFCNYRNHIGGGDERQVECVYAGLVMKEFCHRISGWTIHALECGAATRPDAVKLRKFWEPYRVEWTGIDVNSITEDLYVERIESAIGKAELSDFDLVLAISSLEHSGFLGDTTQAALTSIRRGLSNNGVLILTLPVGKKFAYRDFNQYGVDECHKMFDDAKLQIVNQRLWRWNGEYFENCLEEDVAGTMYGATHNAPRAAGVGAWLLAR